MLTAIQLENYRGFRKYGLRGFSRVNLLVGRNNCGKTSALEAIRLLASGGDPVVLGEVAWDRGESVVKGDDRETARPRVYPVVAHFFHGHEFGPGAYFRLSSADGMGELAVKVISRAELNEQRGLFDDETEFRSGLAVRIEGSRHELGKRGFPVSSEGGLPQELYRYSRAAGSEAREFVPVQFISSESLQSRSMTEMWNRVITEGREPEVVSALQILEPDLSNIIFLSGETTYRYAGRSGILVAFKGARSRNPLGSYGDGMRRLLAVSISLIRTAGGVLLVDEIDTGLHYSIMGDMWRLVVEAAKRTNVQVFATTHSLDCVRGLAWLCRNHPELRTEVSLHKIVPAVEESIPFDAEKIMIAAEADTEVR